MTAYDLGKDQYIQAKGVDISRGGLSFVSRQYIDPGLSVWLSFSIPEPDGTWHEMEAEGIVSAVSDSVDGCHFGVSIIRMSTEDRTDLEALIDRLESEELQR